MEYDKNTDKAPKEEVITEGGISMEIGKTIRLTPAPISAWHPFMKAVRLQNGDLIFNCPLSGGVHRDYALSPKEDADLCSLRSKDNGETWQKSLSETSEDGGKTWHPSPTAPGRAALLKDGTLIGNHVWLTPAADRQTIYERTEPRSLGYATTMTQLSDGSLLGAAVLGGLGKMLKRPAITGGYFIQFWASTNRGVSWREAGTLSFQNFTQEVSQGLESYAEPFFLRATNGDLLLFLRTERDDSTGHKIGPKHPPVKVSRSADEGKTWSKPLEVHPTGVMPVATVLDNGIIVAFTGRGGNRVAASRDNGQTWHCHHNVMSTGQSPNFSGHNAIVPAGPSRALLIYTENHRRPGDKPLAPNALYGAELIGTFVTFK